MKRHYGDFIADSEQILPFFFFFSFHIDDYIAFGKVVDRVNVHVAIIKKLINRFAHQINRFIYDSTIDLKCFEKYVKIASLNFF